MSLFSLRFFSSNLNSSSKSFIYFLFNIFVIIFVFISFVGLDAFASSSPESTTTNTNPSIESTSSSADPSSEPNLDPPSFTQLSEKKQEEYFIKQTAEEQARLIGEVDDKESVERLISRLDKDQKNKIVKELVKPNEDNYLDPARARKADEILSGNSFTQEEKQSFFETEKINLRHFPESFTDYAKNSLNIPNFEMQPDFRNGDAELIYSEGILINQNRELIDVRLRVEDTKSAVSVSVTSEGFLIVPSKDSSPLDIRGSGTIQKEGDSLKFIDSEGMFIHLSGIIGPEAIIIESKPEGKTNQNILSVSFPDGSTFALRNDFGNKPSSFYVAPDGKIEFLAESKEGEVKKYVLDLESGSEMKMMVDDKGDFILKSITSEKGAYIRILNEDGSSPDKDLKEMHIKGNGYYMIKKDYLLGRDFHRFENCIAYFESPVSADGVFNQYNYRIDATGKSADIYTGGHPLSKEEFDQLSYIADYTSLAGVFLDYIGLSSKENDRNIGVRDKNRVVGFINYNPKISDLGVDNERMHLASFRADNDLDKNDPLVVTIFDKSKNLGKEYHLQNSDLILSASISQGHTTVHQTSSFVENSLGGIQYMETFLIPSDRPKWRKDADGRYHEAIPVGDSWSVFSDAIKKKNQEKIFYDESGKLSSKFHKDFLGNTDAGEMLAFTPMDINDITYDKITGSASNRGKGYDILLTASAIESGKHLVKSMFVDVQGHEISLGEGSSPLIIDIQELKANILYSLVKKEARSQVKLAIVGDQQAYITYNGEKIYAPNIIIDLNLKDNLLNVESKGTVKGFNQAGLSAEEGSVSLSVKTDLKTGTTTIDGLIEGSVSFDKSSILAPDFPDEQHSMKASFNIDSRKQGIITASLEALDKNSNTFGKIDLDINNLGENTEYSINGYYNGLDNLVPVVSKLIVREAIRGVNIEAEDISLKMKGQKGIDEFSAKTFTGTINYIQGSDNEGVYEFKDLSIGNMRAFVSKLGELEEVKAEIGSLRGSGVVFEGKSLAETLLNLDNIKIASKGEKSFISYKDEEGNSYKSSIEELEAKGLRGSFINLDAGYLKGKDISFTVIDSNGKVTADVSVQELEALGAHFDLKNNKIRIDTIEKGIDLKVNMNNPKTGQKIEASIPDIAAKDAEFYLEQRLFSVKDIKDTKGNPAKDINLIITKDGKESEFSIDSITGDSLKLIQGSEIILFTENINLEGGRFREKVGDGWEDILMISKASAVSGKAEIKTGTDTEAAFMDMTADRLVASLVQEGVNIDIKGLDSGKRLWINQHGAGTEGGLKALMIEGSKGDIDFVMEGIEEVKGSFLFNGGILQLSEGSLASSRIIKDNLEIITGQIIINDALGFHVSIDQAEQYYGKLTQMRSSENTPEKIIMTIGDISQLGAREDSRREIEFDATFKNFNIIEVGKDGKAEVVLSINTDKINELIGGQEYAHVSGSVKMPSDGNSEFSLRLKNLNAKIANGEIISEMDLKMLVPNDPANVFGAKTLSGEVVLFQDNGDGTISEFMTLSPHILGLKFDLDSLKVSAEEVMSGYEFKNSGEVKAAGKLSLLDPSVAFKDSEVDKFTTNVKIKEININNNIKGPKIDLVVKNLDGKITHQSLEILGDISLSSESGSGSIDADLNARLFRRIDEKGNHEIYLEIPEGDFSQSESKSKGESKVVLVGTIENVGLDLTNLYGSYKESKDKESKDSNKPLTYEKALKDILEGYNKGVITVKKDGTKVVITPNSAVVYPFDLGFGFDAPDMVSEEFIKKAVEMDEKERYRSEFKAYLNSPNSERISLPKNVPSLTEKFDTSNMMDTDARKKSLKRKKIIESLEEFGYSLTEDNYRLMSHVLYG